MPADASLRCPRCKSELEVAGAIGHAELRRCVKPGCQWVGLVIEETKAGRIAG